MDVMQTNQASEETMKQSDRKKKKKIRKHHIYW